MKRNSQELRLIVNRYEQKLAQAAVPLWMDVSEILDILDYYEQKNQYFESEQCMRIALRLHPDNAEVLLRRAYRLKSEGRWEEAIKIVDSLPEQDHFDVLFFRAEIALSQLKFAEAAQLFDTAIGHEQRLDAKLLQEQGEEPMGFSDLLLEAGELFIDYGSTEYAQKYLSQIHSTDPEYNRARMHIAECRYQNGDGEQAIAELEALLDDEPYYLEAWVMLADLCYELQQYERSVEAANFALAIDPVHEKALRFKACSMLSLERYEELLAIYEVYRKHYPNDYTMALSAGEILVNRYQFEAAREVLSRANQCCPNENPDKVRILSDIATTYAAQGRMPEALNMLMGCTSLGTAHADILLQAAQMGLIYGNESFALGCLNDFFAQHTLNAERRQRIAQMLSDHNLYEGVEDLWQRLFLVTESGSTLAAPYLALAARRLRLHREYLYWISYALYDDPSQTQNVFRQVFPNVVAGELLQRARAELSSAEESLNSSQ